MEAEDPHKDNDINRGSGHIEENAGSNCQVAGNIIPDSPLHLSFIFLLKVELTTYSIFFLHC
jgi:hypothetical protein